MSDITMCSGVGCPVKNKCHRYTATRNEYRQSMFLHPPHKTLNGKFSCEMYWGESVESIWQQLNNITQTPNE